MNRTTAPRAQSASLLATLACVFLLATASAQVQHLSIPVTGGMPGRPLVTGITRTNNTVTVTWDGPSGYYQLYQKVGVNGTWQAIGARTNLSRRATVTTTYANTFYKVLGPAPQYAGSQVCIECHGTIHSTEQYTDHPKAFQTLKRIGQDRNSTCLPCHTVGYGLATGFVNETQTPQLAGVQCENCHGPAGNHAANPDDITVRPRAEVAAQVCGGCHTGSQQPHYDEWAISEHANVSLPNMNPNTCGRCHIGSARIAMVKKETVPQNDNNVPIVCATCHDPHRENTWNNPLNGTFRFTNALTGLTTSFTNNLLGRTYTNQLRNPVASLKDFYLTTSDVFSNKYDPNINICGQCHNHRGASWTNNASPPHPSLQYNMLLGTVGELDTGYAPNYPASHSRLEQQCSSCHMQTFPHEDGPPEVPAETGHTFVVNNFTLCASCHASANNASNLVTFVAGVITNDLQYLKISLDYWGANRAPLALRTNYGALSWEYTSPGDLSPGGKGPSSAEQTLIPVNIRKARYNAYLVLQDGSFGTHNAPYAIELLNTAQAWVDEANQ